MPPPPPYKKLLQRCSILFLTLACLLTPPAVASPSDSKWDKETAAFVTRQTEAPFAPNGIVFVGSSSIRLWDLKTAFPHHRTLNCGFGGSQIRDSLDWFERVLAPFDPRLVVFYAGGNDLNAGKSPETVANDARELFERIHATFPKARIAFISSAPNPKRWAQIEKVRALNTAVQAMQASMPFLDYVDAHSAMLGDDKEPLPDIYREDRLHMNEKGYAIWNKLVLPFLGTPDR